jgi:glycosyltransferase involved in cell wall biosynthesis
MLDTETTTPRTLHVISSKQPGGAEYFFTRLVNAMHRAGEPTEAAISTRCRFAEKLNKAIKAHRFPMKGAWDLYSQWLIQKTLKRQQIDIVQTYLGRAARLVPSTTDSVQLVCRVGGFYPQQQYAHADHVICNSQGLCDHMIKGGFPADRIHMIPNFVSQPEILSVDDKHIIREKYGVAADDLLICSVGRLHPIKGMDMLLKAFARLQQSFLHRRCRLLLVGAGQQEESLRQLAESLSIDQDVIWAGWQVTPGPFYQIADIFVCASRQEGFGNVILEAWANQVAVVSTATAGPQELIEHGRTGLITPIDDVDTMTDALRQLADDAPLRSQMVNQASQQLTSRYSETAVVKMYADFYAAICR